MVGEMNISWPEEGGDKAIELLQVSCSSNSRARVNVAQVSTKPSDIDGTTINCCSRSGQTETDRPQARDMFHSPPFSAR